ncbi:hypothetical protein [uncultured Hyphomicrobium sp.]|uniref:hypothetical protein n=1 Tax=uncultured Hyphomicrobium sp. TaxID=194373 RepID=UPI0025FAC23F|nr:hypothetical protein [uncultured Hyphomicrobium sp.]
MPSVSVERLPVQLLGLGVLGFDHLQIVFRFGPEAQQDDWFVIEGLREQDGASVHLAVEGWHGGTTLSDANGGLSGAELADKIGTSASRGAHVIASGSEAISIWAEIVAHATDIEAQRLPYIPVALPSSPLPTINSSSLVASLLHHAGIAVADALPTGLRFSPGMGTLIGTSRGDVLTAADGFTTLVGGGGADVLIGGNDPRVVDKLYGGAGDDTFRWSGGSNIYHGGQPGLAYAKDGVDTVDYSGAGEIRIEAVPAGAAHRQPDFVVTHAGGQDYLFSIEEIVWDGQRDRVAVGQGVGLVARPETSDGADVHGKADSLFSAHRAPIPVPDDPLARDEDLHGIWVSRLPALGLLDVPLTDSLHGALPPVDPSAGE